MIYNNAKNHHRSVEILDDSTSPLENYMLREKENILIYRDKE